MERTSHVRRRPRPSSGSRTIVLVVIGVVVLGVVGLVAFGLWGLGLVADQVAANLRDNPVIVEHIGTIETISLNTTATGREPDDDTYVFDVVGSKGSGTITAVLVTIDENTEEVVAGTLRTKSGQTYNLFPDR